MPASAIGGMLAAAWKCALHTESILGDPYGRDRRA